MPIFVFVGLKSFRLPRTIPSFGYGMQDGVEFGWGKGRGEWSVLGEVAVASMNVLGMMDSARSGKPAPLQPAAFTNSRGRLIARHIPAGDFHLA